MAGNRVVVADDDVLLRAGICSLLSDRGFDVVGQAGSVAELFDILRQEEPDLAVIDVRMPPDYRTEGLDAAIAIQHELPKTSIVLLSAHVDIHHAKTLLGKGRPIGYLLKSRIVSIEDFMRAIDRVTRGESVLDPIFVQRLVTAPRLDDPLRELTPREREVLMLMAEGLSNAGISKRMFLTASTVEKHVRNVMAKLRLADTGDDHRRVRAVVMYLESR